MIRTQNARIRNHLERGLSITPIDALNKFGCFRLGARIYDLKQGGMKIARTMVKKGRKWVAEYRKA